MFQIFQVVVVWNTEIKITLVFKGLLLGLRKRDIFLFFIYLGLLYQLYCKVDSWHYCYASALGFRRRWILHEVVNWHLLLCGMTVWFPTLIHFLPNSDFLGSVVLIDRHMPRYCFSHPALSSHPFQRFFYKCSASICIPPSF